MSYELSKEQIEWLKSDECKQQLKKRLELVQVAMEELRKARRITWEQVNRPMDI